MGKNKLSDLYDCPMKHVSDCLNDEQIRAIEHYLIKNKFLIVKELKDEVKRQIFLSRASTADGRECIAVNFPENYQRLILQKSSPEQTLENALKYTNILKAHVINSNDGYYSIGILMEPINIQVCPGCKDHSSKLAYLRRELYKEKLIDMYNGIIDKLDNSDIVNNVPIDDINTEDF